MIDVFAGRQRRDRSIGEEVKVEPKSQGIAWMPGAVRQKMKGTIHKHIITQIPKMETSWNMVCLVSLKLHKQTNSHLKGNVSILEGEFKLGHFEYSHPSFLERGVNLILSTLLLIS